MRRMAWWTLSVVMMLAWALWLGGLVGVLLAVTSIFATLAPDRAAAGVIAAGLFHRWETVMIVAAGAALVCSAGLSMLRKSVVGAASLVVLMLAGALSFYVVIGITPAIDRMREAGQTSTPEFRRTHGLSMGLYSGVGVLLLVQGVLMPALLNRKGKEEA